MWTNTRKGRCAAAVLALLAALCSTPRAALACAACASGDTTLPALGTEPPFAGRLRTGVSTTYRTETSGRPRVDALQATEYRADLSLAWAPADALFLIVTLPLVERRATDPSLRELHNRGLGDLELRGKLTLYRDRSLSPRHLLALVLGIELPTAPFRHEASGQALPPEAQTGTGALDSVVGLAYALTLRPWSLYVSLDLRAPLLSRADFEPGSSLRSTVALQRQLIDWLSLRGAIDSRWDSTSMENGERAADSGGAVAFVGPDVLWDPGADFTLLVGARAPAFQVKNGRQSEGWTASFAIAKDW
jgi:hypothetical protein